MAKEMVNGSGSSEKQQIDGVGDFQVSEGNVPFSLESVIVTPYGAPGQVVITEYDSIKAVDTTDGVGQIRY